MRLRWSLVSVVLATAVPLVAFAVLVSTILVRHDRDNYMDAIKDRNRAFVSAMDALLVGEIKALQMLTTSRNLAHDDLRGFHDELVASVATQPNWAVIVLNGPDGTLLLDTVAAYGVAPSRAIDQASLDRVVKTRSAVVGDLVHDELLDTWGIPLRVPVLRDGRVVYVLTAIVKPDAVQALIEAQRLPREWVTGVVDAQGRFIARTPPRPVGSKAGPDYLAAVVRSPEGWARMPALDRPDTFTAHLRSNLSQWTVGIGIPATVLLEGSYRAGWTLVGGVLGSLAVGLLVALWLARRVTRPIGQLVAGLPRLGHDAPSLPRTSIDELRELGNAFALASTAIREREDVARRENEIVKAGEQAKDEFLAMLSHELRNPLAALTASAAVLKRVAPGTTPSFSAVNVIERQTRHMARLIEDLLDVSRIAMGKAQIRSEVFDLAQAVQHVARIWEESGRVQQHVFAIEARPVYVSLDRSRVEQIVSNLLDNAVKFTPAGKRITLQVTNDRGRANIVCTDEGVGIAAERLPHVFEPFVQGPQDLSRAAGGMGLGLTLVKRLAELQHGNVTVSSAGHDKGATFVVSFPALDLAAGAGASADTASRAPHRALRILIVEDNEDGRASTAALMRTAGHVVTEASTGSAAVQAARDTSFDLALIDIGLPDIDGFEVARRLRNSQGDSIYLTALTGYGQPEDRAHAIAAGFDGHLTKPATPEQFDALFAAVAAREHDEDTRDSRAA